MPPPCFPAAASPRITRWAPSGCTRCGYLLPWDQKAYWATVVGTNMVGSTPIGGSFLAGLLRGGAEVTGATLLRFYSMHILWLPLFTGIFLWLHLHMIRRTGISGGM